MPKISIQSITMLPLHYKAMPKVEPLKGFHYASEQAPKRE